MDNKGESMEFTVLRFSLRIGLAINAHVSQEQDLNRRELGENSSNGTIRYEKGLLT